MVHGPSAVKDLGIDLKNEEIFELINHKFQYKKVSGSPVRDLIFDKVAMSSLYKLTNEGILPRY